ASIGQVHRAILAMLDPTDFKDFLRNLESEVASILRVDALRLVLESHDCAGDLTTKLGEVLTVMQPGFIDHYCARNDKSSSPTRQVILRQLRPDSASVYGEAADWIQSEAVLKLDFGRGRLPGMLVLGAEDPHQFRASQGTDLLTFFGGVFERQMRHWLG
ncbi:MAG: DUF484 family protein, partial [Pseudomonadota bacterium]